MTGQRAMAWRWALAWALATAVAGTALVRWDIAQRREAFQAEARTAHRMLSQRAAELDAMLATVALLAADEAAGAAQVRLPALHPQVLQVQRRPPGGWPDPRLESAEQRSRAEGRAVVAAFDPEARRFTLLRAAAPAAVAFLVDVDRWRPLEDWPFGAGSPVGVRLQLGQDSLVLDAGAAARGVTPGFVFAKTLGSAALPFELRVQRHTGVADWPWGRLAALALALAVAGAAGAALQRQRAARRRAEEMLRLDRVARLNTLGELAAGLAHELNQPLAAVVAGTQAARRMLDDDDPLSRARLAEALDHARGQATRAAEVLARLRRRVEQPEAAPECRPLDLGALLRRTLALLQPELDAAGVTVQQAGQHCVVQADPVAVEQVLHNLLRNALQALQAVAPGRRALRLSLRAEGGFGVLRLQDSGPGIAPEVLQRLFQPFTSTRAGGLGLGLSLSETLVQSMGGRLTAQNVAGQGAEFVLALPLAASA